MIDVLFDWPAMALDEWRYAREDTAELARWDPLDEVSDLAGVWTLVEADLVPWLSCWPENALELLRRAISLGLTTHPELLAGTTNLWAYVAEPITAIWWPVWEGVFGGEPDQIPFDQVNLVTTSADRFAVENAMFGGWFKPPDPLQLWEWLRAARSVEVERQELAQSAVGLYPTWEVSRQARDENVEWSHKYQGRVAVDAAAQWFRSGQGGLWLPPPQGLVERSVGIRVLVDPLKRVCSPPSLAGGAPESRTLVRSDGTQVAIPTFFPMSDLLDTLVDAAQSLEIDAGDLTAMASAARKREVARPSSCEVYSTWAVIAEATHYALENNLLLRFLSESPS